MLLLLLSLISAGMFLVYGYGTLFTVTTREEYERYGMPRVRVFVGTMQLLGAVGLLVGLAVSPLGSTAAAGLMFMMMLGLVVRYRIHDALRLMVPAASLATLNATIVFLHVF